MKSIKRILALLCALVIAFSVYGQVAVFGGETEDSEIPVPNGDFEDVTEDFATGWSKFGGVMTAEMDTKAYSGSKSVKITASQDNSPWISKTITGGFKPGFFYEMSVFINSNVTGTRGAGIKVEWYDAGNNSLAGASPDIYPSGQYFLNTNDVWVEHKTIFQVPEGTAKTKLYMRVYGLGYAYYDKVTIKLSGGPEPYTFDTSHVFHYMEDKAGSAVVSLNDYYKDKDEGKVTVDFQLYDGNRVIGEKMNVPFTNLKAEYDYSTAIMETSYKAYVMKATVRAADGAVTAEYNQNIYRVDRPSMLDDKGRVVMDGEIFNPIITYHTNVSDYPKAVEGGVNTVQLGYGNAVVTNSAMRNATLSALKANNLKGIFCLYISNNSAGSDANFENTKQIVAMLQDNKDIIGWALKDEPFLSGDNTALRAEFERAYLAIRTIDKTRPIYVCDKRHEDITQKYCDIFCGDYYASNDGDTRSITRELETGRARVQENKGFWELGLTYIMNGVYPGISAVRNTIYRAFEGGVNGMGYYSFSDAGHVEGSGLSTGAQLYNWTIWENFKTLNKVEVPVLFNYFVNGRGITFNSYDDGAKENSLLWYEWFDGDDMYLLAHNRNRTGQNVTIPLTSKNGIIRIGGFTAEPVGLTAQPAITGNGSISITISSEEVVLYKITPDSKIDISRLGDENLMADMNPGFELGSASSTQTLGGTARVAASNVAGGGNYILSMPAANDSIILKPYSTLKPGTNYTLSWWMTNSVENSLGIVNASTEFCVGATKMAKLQTAYNWKWYNLGAVRPLDQTFGRTHGASAAAVWHKAAVSFTTPPTDCDGIEVKFQTLAADPYLALDDFSLVETGAGNIISNGDFETVGYEDEGYIWPASMKIRTYSGATWSNGISLASEATGNRYTEITNEDTAVQIYPASIYPERFKLQFRYKRLDDTEVNSPRVRMYGSSSVTFDAYYPSASAGNTWETYTAYIDASAATASTPYQLWLGRNASASTFSQAYDDVYLAPDENSIGFYKDLQFYYTGDDTRYQPITKGFTGTVATERGEEVISLGDIEAVDGVKTVTTRAHYLPKTTGEESITMLSCVYKYVNGVKTLADLGIKSETTTGGKVIDTVDTVSVHDDGGVYQVEVMVWDSLDLIIPAAGFIKAVLK